MNAGTVDNAGTLQSRLLNTENIEMFRHPKYYKELRKLRNNLDQAISLRAHDGERERATGPGPKRQASSNKLREPQATSDKRQAPSRKHQA
jgi:hypothetical protein